MFLPVLLAAGALGGYALTRKREAEPEDVTPARPRALPPTPTVPAPPLRVSPLARVPLDAWDRFCVAMRDPKNARSVSSSGHIGAYRFTWPRLQDLGWACKVERDGKLWKGVLAPPLTMDRFLLSPRIQDQMFELSSAEYANRFLPAVGKRISSKEGEDTVTLSGVLAIAHRAGTRGAQSWLEKARDRERYPNTTRAFRMANTLF